MQNEVIHGDNLLVMRDILKNTHIRFSGIYIDPPYNRKRSHYSYKNTFANWTSFMKPRLILIKKLLKKDGVVLIAIGLDELSALGLLIHKVFPNYTYSLITIVNNPRGKWTLNMMNTCEYMYVIYPSNAKRYLAPLKLQPKDYHKYNFRHWGANSERNNGTCFYPLIIDKKTCKVIGAKPPVSNKCHPNECINKGNYVYVYPIDTKGAERRWRRSYNTLGPVLNDLVAKKRNQRYEIYFIQKYSTYKNVWLGKRYDASIYGSHHLRKLVSNCSFSYPKSIYNVYDALNMISAIRYDKNANVLDCFSGSGTTGEAVKMLNDKDKGNRHYILVEKNDYAKTVDVPRLKAVGSKAKYIEFNK